jgi:hypothetical protein
MLHRCCCLDLTLQSMRFPPSLQLLLGLDAIAYVLDSNEIAILLFKYYRSGNY